MSKWNEKFHFTEGKWRRRKTNERCEKSNIIKWCDVNLLTSADINGGNKSTEWGKGRKKVKGKATEAIPSRELKCSAFMWEGKNVERGGKKIKLKRHLQVKWRVLYESWNEWWERVMKYLICILDCTKWIIKVK